MKAFCTTPRARLLAWLALPVAAASIQGCAEDRLAGDTALGVVRILAFTDGWEGYRDIGTGTRPIDFGDDSSEWANDGECDDPRFMDAPNAVSPGMARVTSAENTLRDASDCRRLYQQGRIVVPPAGTGTGFVVAPGYVVTNFHVVETIMNAGHTGLIWETDTGPNPRTVPFEIVDYSVGRDIALLHAPMLSRERRPLAVIDPSVTPIRKTDPVYAIGFPGISDYFASEDIGFDFSSDWTDGQIQDILEVPCEGGRHTDCTERQVIQHGADISGGNSGGPLVDLCGSVLGVNTFVSVTELMLDAGGARRLFAVSSRELIPILRENRIQFTTARAYCRASAQPSFNRLIPTTVAALFAVVLALGVLVTRVWRRQRLEGAISIADIVRREMERLSPAMSRRILPARAQSGGSAGDIARPWLLAGRGELKRLQVSMGSEPAIIGSGEGSTLTVDRPVVSRQHARVGWDEDSGRFWLEDLGSLNGTFLRDGEQLEPGRRYWLNEGDSFYVVHEGLSFYVLLAGRKP